MKIISSLALSLLLGCGLLDNHGTLVNVPKPVASSLQPLVADLPPPYRDYRPDHRLLYVYLADKDWAYPRHKVSGLILRREISAMFGYQAKDGTCGVELLVVGQENLGDEKFGPLQVRDVTGPDGYPRYLYRPGPCTEITGNQDVLRKQGCPECVVGEPTAKPAS